MVADEELALVMVKPDGVRQRLTPAIVEFLAARGYQLLGARRLTLDPETRAELYATTRSSGRLDWELNGVLYTLAPVDALILRRACRPPGHAAASSYLSHELKGSFIPTRARPGTLRGDFNAMNPIFNVVHASDSAEELGREAAILFGPAWRRPGGTGHQSPWRRQSDQAPCPICHWGCVRGTLAHLLAPGRPESGRALLDEVRFPGCDDQPDGRRSAMEAARRAAAELRGRLSAGLSGPGELLFGDGDPGFAAYEVFREEAARRAPWVSAWNLYLTYTTLRFLNLCLEEAS